MPTDWNIAYLPQALDDLASLERSPDQRRQVRTDIEDEFSGMKGDRVTKVLVQGSTSSSIDRLKSARTPGSVRVQVRGDRRATVLCLPSYLMAYVTHIFHKSQDPRYKRAPGIHDARVAAFVRDFGAFIDR